MQKADEKKVGGSVANQGQGVTCRNLPEPPFFGLELRASA
jgi:hypothetical protein